MLLHVSFQTTSLNIKFRDEFDANVIITPPTVKYRALVKDDLRDDSMAKLQQLGLVVFEENGKSYIEFGAATHFPPTQYVESYVEQYIEVTIMVPQKYFTALRDHLVENRRAEFISSEYLGDTRLVTVFHMPLS